MLFRTKDSNIISIDRRMFNTDKDYYSYIKTQVVGEGIPKNKSSMVDDLVLLIKNKSMPMKNPNMCNNY